MEKEEYRRLFELEERLWWFLGMRDISLTLLNRFLPQPIEPLAILDAGCGTGGMIRHLTSYGSVVGVDLASDALAFARLRNPERLVQGSLLRLPFPAETFDLVSCFDVIYHQAVPDDDAALAEIARVLRKEGTLLLRVPAHDRLRSQHDNAVHTRHRYARKELDEKLRRRDLHPLFMSYANCFLFPVAFAMRSLEKFVPGEDRGSEVRATSSMTNRLLIYFLKLEALILRATGLPFGLSLLAVARRRP